MLEKIHYFLKRLPPKVEKDGIQITCVLSLAIENVTPVELAFAEDMIQMSYKLPKKYLKDIPENINK